MDDGARNPYVANAMNLLLLLSALLSALTGAGGAVRGPQAAQTIACEAEAARAVPAAKAIAAHRPTPVVTMLVSVAGAMMDPTRTLAQHVPIWASRPRI